MLTPATLRPGLMRRFRLLFKPLHTEDRYYANYDFVRSLDLAQLGVYRELKRALVGRKRVLDFGCGIGYVTNFLDAQGVDKNPKTIALAKAAYPKTKFRAAGMEQLAKEGRRWDAVVAVNVLEHLEDADRERFFKLLPKLLTKTGRLFIVYDSMYHPLQLLSGILHPGMLLTDPTHVHCWPQRAFRALLEGSYEIERDKGANILSRGLPWTNRYSTAHLYVCRPKRVNDRSIQNERSL